MTTRYNTAALRDLISAALSGDEFTALAFDHFRPVYDQFAAGQTRHQRVQLLLDHAARNEQMARLAALIQEINPARYREFAGRLLAPDADAAPARPQTNISYQATLTGSGAIAQGDGAQAASGDNIVTGGRGPASGSIAQRHPQQQLAEWQRRYETLSKRIAALDKDLGRTLDSETKVVLEERRQELAAAREQAAEGIAQIEEQLAS
ncbi:MAG: hypothetical protein IPO15_25405 [Anaerolineae bacterium]|uniref:hypothetical protein n=1 Tax=Candidatus Amarolinea dominans TaxID=3140696 RepID=UPI003135AB41|nr:hypothetical protein [Anaerolineae bacterium]